ncbi:hypothetical protein BDV12DRAFT_188913 [Aspergillus spectabilis]
MPAFTLSTKMWEIINIDWVSEMDSPDAIPDANINPDDLNMIKALSDRQIKSKVPWSADFIKHKGEGVVVLLHARFACSSSHSPHLGTEEDSVEAEPTKWFSLAQRWRAILLIDEADIFVERREHKDISRNGIVSAFLRKIEYFGGLFFLTTNRAGHIDGAFISQVHRKKIWKNFFDKLNAERNGKIKVTPSGINSILGDDVSVMDWNGREIRNAFQTAIALAEYDQREIIVEASHFEKLMNMSRSFQEYMDSIRGDTKARRAAQFYGRNDYGLSHPVFK